MEATYLLNSDIFHIEILLIITIVLLFSFHIFLYRHLKKEKLRERRVSEDKIFEQAFLEKFVHTMPIGLALVDVKKNDECILLNEKFCEYSGLEMTSAVGTSMSENPVYMESKGIVFETRMSDTRMNKSLWPNAPPNLFLAYTATPLFDQNGEIIYIMADIIDITPVISKQEEIRSVSIRFQKYVQYNIAAIGFFEPVYKDGVFIGVRIDDVNDNYRTLFGHLGIDVIGDFIPESESECKWLMDALAALQQDKTLVYSFDEIVLDLGESGMRYLSGSAFWCSHVPPLYSVYIIDKTEEVKRENLEMNYLSNLKHTLLGLGVLNDKIRNPLTIILSYIEMAEFEPEKTNALVRCVQQIDTFVSEIDENFDSSNVIYRKMLEQKRKK
jgi:PAS domain-containing protein